MSLIKPPSPYWFPAKDFGWGWTLPKTWQGWAVLIAYAVIVLALRKRFWAVGNKASFWAWFVSATLILLSIMYWKGEPPKWSWGN